MSVLVLKIGGSVRDPEALLQDVAETAARALDAEGVSRAEQSVLYQIDMRYKGQGMQLMNDALFDLVKRNIIDPKEAYMKAVHKTDMKAQLERANYRVELTE